MNNEQLFNLLIFGLQNCGAITSVDRYEETSGSYPYDGGYCRRLTWYKNDRIGYEIAESNDYIEIVSIKGIITLWKEELTRVEVNGGNISDIRVVCGEREYRINFNE